MPFHTGFDPSALAESFTHTCVPAEDLQQISLLEHQMLVECARLEVEQARVRELAEIRGMLEQMGVRQELLIEGARKGKR